MANKKMTYVEATNFAADFLTSGVLPEGVTKEAVIERLTELSTSLQKKNSGVRKKTAAQEQNDLLRDSIVQILSDGVMRNISDLRDALGLPSDTTPQRITGLLRPLVEDGVVKSVEIKRKRCYTLAEISDPQIPTEG